MNLQAMLILSGGMDSVTLLHFLKAKNYEVSAISFDYGQRHSKELQFAEFWGKNLCQAWKKIEIPFIKDISEHSALLHSQIPIPHEHYTSENQKITVVPNRNMIMLSIAIAWAENLKITKVFFGAHANDRMIYPDCRYEFISSLNQASVLATYSHVEIEAPFLSFRKYEIAQIGKNLNIDYSKTWSCYEGNELHCGKCATCQERKEAFQKAGMMDPTRYMAQ